MTARDAVELLTEMNEAGELDDAVAYMEEYADIVEIAQKRRIFVEIEDGVIVPMALVNQDIAQEEV